MLHRPNAFSAQCPTRQVLDRIGDTWAVLILIQLGEGRMRFNALRRRIENISQKMLSQTLKSLERDGLITRRAFATVPVTVEYALTDLGRTLARTVHQLTLWAEAHIGEVQAAQQRYDRGDVAEPSQVKRLDFMAGRITAPEDFNTMGSEAIEDMFEGRT